MSDRERKHIFREQVPGSEKFIIADIVYRKDARPGRGYYFSAIVAVEQQENGYTSTQWTLGEQSKSHLIEQATRFNAKRLAELCPSDELINLVRAESLASLNAHNIIDKEQAENRLLRVCTGKTPKDGE